MPPKPLGRPPKRALPPNGPADPSREYPLQYTTFHPPPPINAKNIASSYLRTDSQTWMSRAANESGLSLGAGMIASRGRKRKRGGAVAGMPSRAEGTPSELAPASDEEAEEDDPRGPASRTIVLHPGSQYLRIGRATDLYPQSVPNVLARRKKLNAVEQGSANGANGASLMGQNGATAQPNDVEMRDANKDGKSNASPEKGDSSDLSEPSSENEKTQNGRADGPAVNKASSSNDDAAAGSNSDEEDETSEGEGKGSTKDLLSSKIELLRADLRTIMRAAKLRPVTNGRGLAANYNEQVRGEKVAEHNDVYGIEWTDEDEGGSNDVLLGERALRLPCFSPPPGSKLSKRSERPWQLYRPFRRGGLDLARYKEHYGASAALQALLGDIRAIWEYAISHDPADSEERREAGQVAEVGLGIPQREWASHSVILIVPDLFSREHIRALVQLLLGDMGFGAACVQTEGVCATFGAGISGACVVDFGAEHVGVCCVDEGLVLPDSRLELSYGGADISSFFFALLQRANFPYADADLNARIADAMLIDSLKERLCTLNPTDFGLNMYDFHVRLPGKPTTKYMLRTYDEVIIAPMCLFNPRVIDFDVKRPYLNQVVWVDEAEDPGEPVTATSFGMLPITLAMQNCTRHLLPPEPPAPVAAAPPPASTEESTPLPTPAGEVANPLLAKAADENGRATPSGISSAGTPPIPSSEAPGPGPTLPTASTTDGAVQPSSAPAAPTPSAPQVDVAFEASKVPLDVAVWNSLLAAGGGSGGGGGGGGNAEERIKRLASNIVFTGGTAQMPGLAQALEARLNNHLSAHSAAQGDTSSSLRASVIPPPRDMDPRLLAWKGMAVLARLESVGEFWVRAKDWEAFGWRALREKTLFL